MKGSSGICDTTESATPLASVMAPPAEDPTSITMEKSICQRRRFRRRRKKVFQSSFSGASAVLVVEAASEAAAVASPRRWACRKLERMGLGRIVGGVASRPGARIVGRSGRGAVEYEQRAIWGAAARTMLVWDACTTAGIARQVLAAAAVRRAILAAGGGIVAVEREWRGSGCRSVKLSWWFRGLLPDCGLLQ